MPFTLCPFRRFPVAMCCDVQRWWGDTTTRCGPIGLWGLRPPAPETIQTIRSGSWSSSDLEYRRAEWPYCELIAHMVDRGLNHK